MKSETKITKLFDDRDLNDTVSGEIRTGSGDTFQFTAKCGEWAQVEWLDDEDHSHKRREHAEAQRFATKMFVTRVAC